MFVLFSMVFMLLSLFVYAIATFFIFVCLVFAANLGGVFACTCYSYFLCVCVEVIWFFFPLCVSCGCCLFFIDVVFCRVCLVIAVLFSMV